MSNSVALSTLERSYHEYETIDRNRGLSMTGTGDIDMVPCPAYKPHESQKFEDEDDQGYMNI